MAMKNNKIKLISFDLDDTLWPIAEVIHRAEKNLVSWFAVNCPEVLPYYSLDRVLAVRTELINGNPKLKENLTKLRLKVIQSCLALAGVSIKERDELAKRAFDVFFQGRNDVNFFPGALTLLEELNKNYTLAAITNGNADLRSVGIDRYFKYHFSAENTGYAKPDSRIFRAAFCAENIVASQVIHIGDHPEQDINAAGDVGCHTIWVDMLKRKWPEGLVAPVETVQSLPQVISCVERIERRLGAGGHED